MSLAALQLLTRQHKMCALGHPSIGHPEILKHFFSEDGPSYIEICAKLALKLGHLSNQDTWV